MDTPDSASLSDSGLLEYASTLIKIVIGLMMIAGVVPKYASNEGMSPQPGITASQHAGITAC